MSTSLTCPSCGSQIKQLTRSSQTLVCAACSSTLLLTSGSLENVGKSAILTEFPSIFTINQQFAHKDWAFTPVGRVRYDYGEGWWDEWFVKSSNGKESWVSVDEGEIAIEALMQRNIRVPKFEELRPGDNLVINRIKMTVIEKNTCTMIGAEGELPFKLVLNDTYNYIDLLGPKRVAFSIEYQDDGIDCYKGAWVDPFDIRRL